MKNKPQINLTKALEDYLETILLLQRDSPAVRVRDIAKKYDVSPVSVSHAMKRLADAKLVSYQRREFIQLTDKGELVASKIYSKHTLLYDFLKRILKVDEETAREDACKLEHSISETTFLKLSNFIEKIKK